MKYGFNVTVLTCVPNFPDGVVHPGYKNRLVSIEKIDGINVIRVWSFISSNKGILKRILDYISFAISALIFGMRINADLIIATSPQFFTALSGKILSKIKKIPWIMEIRDLWPESIIAVGALKNKSLYRLLTRMEYSCYDSASKIISVTNSFKTILVKNGVPKSKISVVSNGVNTSLFSKRDKDLALLKKLGLEKKFVVSYIGTIGMSHAISFIVKSAAKIKNDKIVILLIGSGAEKDNVRNQIRYEKVNNVILLDTLPKKEIVNYIASIDVALINLKKSELFKTVIPSKIFENAAMEKPMLLGVDGEARDLIEQYNAGIYFHPENEKDFIDKLQKMYADVSFYKACQIGCSNLSKDYNRKELAKKMLKHIKKTVNQTRMLKFLDPASFD